MHVSVHVHACISPCTCMYQSMYMHVSVHVHACISPCTCMYQSMYMHVSVHVHACISPCTCMYQSMYMHVSVHVHACISLHAHKSHAYNITSYKVCLCLSAVAGKVEWFFDSCDQTHFLLFFVCFTVRK